MKDTDANLAARDFVAIVDAKVTAGRRGSSSLSEDERELLREESDSIRKMVFETLVEFVPDGALWTIQTDGEGDPLVVTVADDHVFLVEIAAVDGKRFEAVCKMVIVPNDHGLVTVKSRYWERPNPATPPQRRSIWTFDLPKAGFFIRSNHTPGDSVDEAERVAQTIASIAGWPGLAHSGA